MADLVIGERAPGTRCCGAITRTGLGAAEAAQLSEDFGLLGHPVRLQLLALLARHGGQVCVCDLEAAVAVKQPTVSHHLRLLREAGLVEFERQGQWAYYFIRRDALAALHERVVRQLAALA